MMLLCGGVGLLLGLGIKYPRVGALQATNDRTAGMLTVTRLELRLASAVVEVQRGEFDEAVRERREFYDAAEQAVADGVAGPSQVTGRAPTRAALRRAVQRREVTLALLGGRDEGAAPALIEQLEDLRRAAPDGQPAP
jgi:hypothetical protein